MRKIALGSLFLSFVLFSFTALAADERYSPYVLASSSAGDVAGKADSVRTALQQNGFEIAGEYAPYDNALIIIVTNDAMRKNAAKSDMGGYGAAARVSLTQNGDQVEVSYTHPGWMAHVYRMDGDNNAIADKLKAALGAEKVFGSEGGRTADNLREYHYMMFMPYFNDQVKLAEYGSHSEAVAAVNAALSAGKGGASKVYQIQIDGKDETLFGVALKQGDGADATVMGVTDSGTPKHTAHLPYDMLVSGSNVYMLHGKFRIAQSFPDLTMGTFMKISSAPDAIEASMRAAAGK